MHKSIDPKTGEKTKEPVGITNMNKAVTARSLIGGTIALHDANLSTFGLAAKVMARALFVRRNKSDVKTSRLDASLAEGMD